MNKTKWSALFIIQLLSLLSVLVRAMTFIDTGPLWRPLYNMLSWTFPLAPLWLVLFSAIAIYHIYRIFKMDNMSASEWICRLAASLMSILNLLGWAIWTPFSLMG